MPRVTAEEVRAIGGFPSSIDLDPFIEDASLLIDEVAKCAGSTLSDARLKSIEKWLSAHLAKMLHPSLVSKSIAGASTSFEGRASGGKGLEMTSYGQQALLLDTSGCLRKLTQPSNTIAWGGTELS